MFSTFLSYATDSIVVGSVCLVIGVMFSQKIKDFLTGVPAELRTAMISVEAKAKADVAAAQADVLAKLHPTVAAAPVTPATPPAPAA